MSQSIIGSLRVRLGLDSAQFEQGARRAMGTTDGMQKRFVGLARSLAATAAGYGITVAGLAAISRAGAEAAREIENFSKVANAQPAVFQRWTAGAKTVGIQQEKLADILKDVNDRVGDFVQTGGGPMADFFEKIAPKVGVTAEMFRKLSGPEALQLYVSSLEKAKVNQQEMTFYLEAMASDASMLLPLLANNGEEMKRLGDRAERLGVVLDASALAALRRAREAVDRSSEAWLGLRNRLAVEMAPALEAFAKASEAVAIALQPVIANLDRMAVYAGTAAAIIGGRLAVSLAITAARTLTLAGVLGVLRTALIRTGIGALIVGAGELVYQFTRLVKGAGGFGNAMKLLGEVAAGVWEGIVTAAQAIPPGLGAVWKSIASGFYFLVSDLANMWSSFLQSMAGSIEGVDAFSGVYDKLQGNITGVIKLSGDYAAEASKAAQASEQLSAEAARLASEGFEKAKTAAAKLAATVAESSEETEDGSDAADRMNKALGGLGGSADKAKGKVDKLKSAAKAFADAMKEAAFTTQEWGEEKASILISGIDGVSTAFGDLVARGFTDFKDFASSILKSFQGMISQMVAMAVKNRIMISLGFGGVTGATGGGIGFGGLLGGGKGGSSGGGFGLGSLLGGIGSSFKALGSIFGIGSTTMASLGGFGAALGAAIPAIGILAVGISALIGKTTELDRGIRVTVNGMDALVQTFRRTETSRLFGLLKSKKTSYGSAPDAIADPVSAAVSEIQSGVIDMAGALAIGADAFKSFRTVLSVSTRGMSQEDAARAVQDALKGMADEMAEMALRGHDVIRAGEGASDALSRLSTSLAATQTVFDTLGHTMFEVSIAGADMASNLVEAFGGLDAFNAATTRYFEAFYPEAERIAIATRQATSALAEYGVALPKSRAQFRAIVEAIDLTSERGRALYATMIGLADTLDAILPAAQGLTDVIAQMVGTATSAVGVMISEAQETARASERAASDWYSAAASLRGVLRDMRAQEVGTGAQRLGAASSAMQTAFLAARGGDVEAAREFPALARTFLDVAESQASSSAEFRRAQSQVLSQTQFLAGISELTGASKDVMRTLAEEQVEALNDLNDYLQSVETIDPEDIAAFEARLGSLQSAIEQAEMFSYDYLKERLKVTVDLLPEAKIPEDVRKLIATAAKGIESTIEFAVRAENLTPDLRWLALTGSSQHIASLEFAITKSLPADLRKLAVTEVMRLDRAVNFTLGKALPADLTRLALTEFAEVSRSLRVALGASNQTAIKVALATSDTVRRTFTAAFAMGALSPEQRSLLTAINGGTVGKITLTGGFVFDPSSGFRTWFESSAKAKIATPMDQLRGALSSLREAVIENNARLASQPAAPSPKPAPKPATPAAPTQPKYSASNFNVSEGLVAYTDTVDRIGATKFKQGYTVRGPLGGTRTFDTLTEASAIISKVIAGTVPAFASGTSFAPGGVALVGEEGPELVNVPRGSRVYPAPQTRSMLDNSGLQSEVRMLREETQRMREELVDLGLRGNRNTLKLRKLAEKDDTIGTPPVRTEA